MNDTNEPNTIRWQIKKPETGGSPEQDPRKATFFWKHGEAVVKTQDFTQEELEAQIRRFEKAGEDVPEAFREALRSFEHGS